MTGFADVIAQLRGEPGRTLEEIQQRAVAQGDAADRREALRREQEARDGDEIAANLLSRGYAPGAMSHLSQRLADTTAELEEERDKVGRGERRRELVRGLLERGQIGGLEAAERMDGDFGDEHRVEQLERRAESLRGQIAEMAELMRSPQDRQHDTVQEAATRAQRILAEVAEERRLEDEADARGRARLKAERAAFRRSQRPFAGGSAGAAGERSLPPVTEYNGPSVTRSSGYIVGVR
jgi:hypothetical protein